SVNRTPVRWARLGHGDELLVGDTLFAVRYDPAPGPAVPPTPGVAALAETPAAGPAPFEAGQLQSELDAARAEAEALRSRVAELERSAAELAETREALDRVTGERTDAERQWQAELDAARAEAAAREQQ